MAPPAPPQHPNLAGWVFGGLLLAVLVYEIWAAKTGRQTISQWLQRKMHKHPWWRPVAAGIIGVLLWHLLVGGPI